MALERLAGVTGSMAVKAPVRVATTEAITLSGLQSIDGVTLVAGDRVLVKDQASPVDNGIYAVKDGAWGRAPDCDGARDLARGTFVYVNEGTANVTRFFKVTNADPIVVGAGPLSFSEVQLVTGEAYANAALAAQVAAEAAQALAEAAQAGAEAARDAAEATAADVAAQIAALTFSANGEYRANSPGDRILKPSVVWNDAIPAALPAVTGTVTLNLSNGINFAGVITGTITLANPTNQKPGQSGFIDLTQDGTGSRLITYGTAWQFPTGAVKTLSTAADAVDTLFYTVKANGVIRCSLQKGYTS